jgi:hypothetical protein
VWVLRFGFFSSAFFFFAATAGRVGPSSSSSLADLLQLLERLDFEFRFHRMTPQRRRTSIIR